MGENDCCWCILSGVTSRVLRVPYPKNNFPGSGEFSAIRVRRKVSYFPGWIVEWISPGINEYHMTHCWNARHLPLWYLLWHGTWKHSLGKQNPLLHTHVCWGRSDTEQMANTSHISWWAPGRWSCIVVRSPTQKHSNISSQGLPAQHHPSFRPKPQGDSASVTGCLLLIASVFVALNL